MRRTEPTNIGINRERRGAGSPLLKIASIRLHSRKLKNGISPRLVDEPVSNVAQQRDEIGSPILRGVLHDDKARPKRSGRGGEKWYKSPILRPLDIGLQGIDA